VAPDESFALVTAACKPTPGDATTISPDDVVSVIDLQTRRVTATLPMPAGPAAVS
jgi:YVTN family beta-propeller protein